MQKQIYLQKNMLKQKRSAKKLTFHLYFIKVVQEINLIRFYLNQTNAITLYLRKMSPYKILHM